MKALLFANVGSDTNGYYHVGDEAMFLEQARFYQENFPSIQLFSFVSLLSPVMNEITQQEGSPWPNTVPWARRYLLTILFKTWLWTKFKIFRFSPEQFRFIQLIMDMDVIHFTGGGFLTTECGAWFYYALIILGVAKFCDKPVFLASQSIGPFSWLDRQFAIRLLDAAQIIILREPTDFTKLELQRQGLTKPEILKSVDAAYFLPLSQQSVPHHNSAFRIGLSLHSRADNLAKLKVLIELACHELLLHHPKIELVLIPHILNEKGDYDLAEMKSILTDLPKEIQVMLPNFSKAAKSSISIAEVVKAYTSNCDLIISSRYHGLIFGLSLAIPCIALSDGKYQIMKNSAALQFGFGHQFQKYLVNVQAASAQNDIVTTLNWVLTHTEQIHQQLKTQNQKLQQIQRLNDMILAKKINKTLI